MTRVVNRNFLIMASETPPLTQKGPKKRKNDFPLEDLVVEESWPKFIVLSSKDPTKPLAKVSPFIIEKSIKGCAGDVKNVTKMKSGSFPKECS